MSGLGGLFGFGSFSGPKRQMSHGSGEPGQDDAITRYEDHTSEGMVARIPNQVPRVPMVRTLMMIVFSLFIDGLCQMTLPKRGREDEGESAAPPVREVGFTLMSPLMHPLTTSCAQRTVTKVLVKAPQSYRYSDQELRAKLHDYEMSDNELRVKINLHEGTIAGLKQKVQELEAAHEEASFSINAITVAKDALERELIDAREEQYARSTRNLLPYEVCATLDSTL